MHNDNRPALPMHYEMLARAAGCDEYSSQLFTSGHHVGEPLQSRLKLEIWKHDAIIPYWRTVVRADAGDFGPADAAVANARRTDARRALAEIETEYSARLAMIQGAIDSAELAKRIDGVRLERVRRTDEAAAAAAAEAAAAPKPNHAPGLPLPPKADSLESRADQLFGRPYEPPTAPKADADDLEQRASQMLGRPHKETK